MKTSPITKMEFCRSLLRSSVGDPKRTRKYWSVTLLIYPKTSDQDNEWLTREATEDDYDK